MIIITIIFIVTTSTVVIFYCYDYECPGIEYQYALVLVNLPTVAKHHNDICRPTFESICNDSGSKLKKLLPPLHECKYKLRHMRTFNEPRCKTNRAKNSFIMASCSLANRF